MGHHDGAIPEEGDICPGQRGRDDGRVDEARVRVVTEVEGGEVDEVDDDNHLGPVEVGAHKEHDKGKVQEVVENEVATNTGGSVSDFGLGREQVANVSYLQDEEDDPVGNVQC